MDVTPFLEPKIAPRALFDRLDERRDRPRFYVPTGGVPGAWRAVTWGELAGAVQDQAQFLASALELAPGERAAIFAGNSVEWLAAALAIQAAGGVMVPIYPASTREQAAYVLEHSDARVLYVDRAALTRLGPAPAGVRKVIVFDDEVVAGSRDGVVAWPRTLLLGAAAGVAQPGAFERRMDAVSLDQPALMLYTSGTSGHPKGVPLSHRNVAVNGADWLRCNAPLLEEGAVDLLWLPMSHIFGLGEACLGNTLGFTTYLADPATVLGRLPEVRPSVFMSVPALWEKLAGAAKNVPAAERRAALDAVTGGRLRFCLSGGAGLAREVKELFHAAGVLIIEGYGLTETSPTLTLNRPDAFRFDSVGRPLPSVELRLADDGEILARGASVFRGYHKDPEATRDAFTDDGWFKTGDVGRFTDDGFLQIVDRKKDIFVTAGGKNIPPANLELRFRDDPFLAHVVVYGDGKRYLVAGVWLNDDAVRERLERDGVAAADRPAAIRALVQTRIDAVNASLASYETIKKFAVIDTPLSVAGGLLTATLKVKRKQVHEAFRAQLEGLYS